MEIKSKEFEKEILKHDGVALVDFWGSWCPPCKRVEETLKEILKEYKDKIKIRKMNVDKNPYYAKKYDIRGVPAFLIFKEGKEIERHVGAKSKEQLVKIIENHI